MSECCERSIAGAALPSMGRGRGGGEPHGETCVGAIFRPLAVPPPPSPPHKGEGGKAKEAVVWVSANARNPTFQGTPRRRWVTQRAALLTQPTKKQVP